MGVKSKVCRSIIHFAEINPDNRMRKAGSLMRRGRLKAQAG